VADVLGAVGCPRERNAHCAASAAAIVRRGPRRQSPRPNGYGLRGPADAASPTRTRPRRAWRRCDGRDRTDRLGLKRRITLAEVHSGAHHRHDGHNQQKPPTIPLSSRILTRPPTARGGVIARMRKSSCQNLNRPLRSMGALTSGAAPQYCRDPHAALEPKRDSRVLVLTYRFRRPGPMVFLPFRCLFCELAPLECSQLHHIADRESARQTSQSIALRRFAEAFFTRIHVQPQ
jgi:hypothetical protein